MSTHLYAAGRIPFDTVASHALASADAVLSRWLPDGKRQGREYVARNPTRADRKAGSFKVNTHTGEWADFATGECGGDLVSLVAMLNGSNQGEAAREVAEFLNLSATVETMPASVARRTTDDPAMVSPVPDGAPAPKRDHMRYGKPSTTWTYRDEEGRELFHVCRFDPPGERKQVLPLTLWRTTDGALQWRWKGAPEPRPLFGLDRLATLPDALVVVCEGEKAADAAQRLMPDAVCITSPNGASAAYKADWRAAAGRKLIVWPDADAEGTRYAVDVVRLTLAAGAASVAVLDVKALRYGHESALPAGFDAADFESEGRYVESLRAAILRAPATAPEMTELATATVATPATQRAEAEWPELLPLVEKIEALPYPVDALPQTVRAAVEEVLGFSKAPVAMVASCALSALSLGLQAHADVKRAERLTGPTGLFLLTIADSGERKSTCDGFFTSAIREYQGQQAEAAKPVIRQFRSELAAWEAKRNGLLDAIRADAKKGADTGSKEVHLHQLEDDRPEPPRVPRLMYGDATPEALAWSLAKQWPSGGVVSAEAGIVFGAHGMGKDSIMRNLALLNTLWDGSALTIDRRKEDGSFTVKGARLTVALQVQEATLRSFFDRSGALARGTGFLARFLVAWPDSTQGNRLFTEPPEHWPALAAFNRRMAAVLANAVPVDDGGELNPPMLPLAPDAKAAWVMFHDAIERELRTGGELYDVRDVASKCADNAARLAALFQGFEHGGGAVGLEAFECASRIAAWHLHEARRFFGELALPETLANAARLDAWVIAWCRREHTCVVSRRDLQRCGPNGLRDKAVLDESLRELTTAGRVRPSAQGRRKDIELRPSLLQGDLP
ncbi:MAG: DUF3987 domain-containing protein [Panacagrimonas sp.]